MKGIWAGKGFEKVDVQKEIKSLRKDISKSILKKVNKRKHPGRSHMELMNGELRHGREEKDKQDQTD